MSYELDEFEQEILDSIENEEWVSVQNEQNRIEDIVSYANNDAGFKDLEIKLSKTDFDKIQRKAASKGIETSRYINDILHSFAKRV